MKPPLTWKKLGSTRCVGCERLFTDDPRPSVETEATELTGGRPYYKANRPVLVTRLWHAACLAEFEESNARYRAQIDAENRVLADEIRAHQKVSGCDQ